MIELDLRKKSCPIPLVETRKFINNNKNVDFKIILELFGNGSDELSNVFMKSYFYALDESITLPSNIIFINSGVKLLTNENIIKNIEKDGF